MIVPLVVIGAVVAVVGIGVAVWSWRERARILGAPVVEPDNASARGGEVIVSGVARGTVTTSPWTGRTGLLFSATEITETRRQVSGDRDEQRETRRRALGTHLERIEIASVHPGAAGALEVRPTDKITLRHFAKITSASSGLNLPSITIGSFSLASSDRSRVEEIVVSDGDRVWVYGTIQSGADGRPYLTGRQIWSAKAPDAMAAQLRWTAIGGAVGALVGAVLAVVGLTA